MIEAPENTALVEISKGRQMLAQANDIQAMLTLRDMAAAAQLFANAQGFLEAAQEAKIFQLQAERKAGAWLKENVNHNGGKIASQDGSQLPDGITWNESARWQAEASLPEEKFNEWIDESLANGWEISAAGLRRIASNMHVSDDSYEWYTPKEYIQAARLVMGNIDLDPASCEEANKVIGAHEYYTLEDGGLARDWFGCVWLNPPYNMPNIENFTARAHVLYQDEKIDSAIILVNNATDAGWFHTLLENYPVCFTRGRVKYWGPHASQARQGQAIFYLGEDIADFVKEFSRFGVVVSRNDNP